jgi:hypothetical protein
MGKQFEPKEQTVDEDRKVAKDQDTHEGNPGLWAVLNVIAGIGLGGRAIGALVKGKLTIPFVADVLAAQQPILFYCAVTGLAAVAILAIMGGYFYWQEWRAATKATNVREGPV